MKSICFIVLTLASVSVIADTQSMRCPLLIDKVDINVEFGRRLKSSVALVVEGNWGQSEKTPVKSKVKRGTKFQVEVTFKDQNGKDVLAQFDAIPEGMSGVSEARITQNGKAKKAFCNSSREYERDIRL